MDSNNNAGGSLASRFASRRCVLTNRRLCLAVATRFANRRLVFSIAAVSILSAKCIHIYAHITALPPAEMAQWGLSFFAQDTALLLMLRLLLDAELPLFASVSCLRFLATSLACLITFMQHALASINISFFAVAGSELHWRNIGLAGDSSSWSVLLTGLVSCSIAFVTILVLGWLLQDISFALAGMAIDIVKLPFTFLFSKITCCRRNVPRAVKYDHVPQKELDLEDGSDGDEDYHLDGKSHTLAAVPTSLRENKAMWLLYTVIGILLVAQITLSIIRPIEGSLIFMSWTPILLPFIDFAHSAPTLASLIPHHGESIGWGWDNQTALAEPIRWEWLPKRYEPLPGFEDWYEDDVEHYNAAHDPLKISNLEDDVLAPLRGKLVDINIRHVVLIKLESTRKDVFPIKKNGQIWQKLAETWENGTFPEEVQGRLANLTQTANFLTGDYNDGFDHNVTRRRGGINVNNDHTTGTYTLKSLPGTLCGITPLVADFNVEYDHHVYQPCLPHIFNAFNTLNHSDDSVASKDEYTKYKWNNRFMMSVTNFYDKQDLLMPVLGYKDEDLIHKEYLQSDAAKFGKVTLPEINYYGMRESAIEDYIQDAFKTAKEKNERVFLTHLTSTAHHPFKMPDEETYVPLAAGDKLEDLSHYVNTIGFVDRWLGRILEILEEQSVSDETLVILVGDHGLSVPETGAVTPYYQPNIGNFHVPLVLSHPKLPPIDINSPVNSIAILPTILDLLIETGSLSPSDRKAAGDLVRNYEGQSLIRPLHKESKHTGLADWQFTVMNTGRAQIATRNARDPNWRLVVPVVKDIEWRFTNVEEDPYEKDAVLSFDFESFLQSVEDKHGLDASKWVEDAAFITRWWVDENAKRWRFSP
ncbi:hypothetical protein QQS21_009599 [Conoideocrella luteorostrata]|uniref:Sulfatase N-terminal domain-containing protein n=1 Tax=Conoideocrella luteorostrata TaxID=1105319 RepID=A0AAJ0CIY5_9HYPO|nr:hypothetical protein QQS21_009599 [Conoideocrella luteorostrata]